MPITSEPLNKRLLPAPTDEEPIVANLKGEAIVGTGETAGEHFYLCYGCGRTLFRRFKPDQTYCKGTAFRCRCGQTNVFEEYLRR
jgi:hypothetical protein